MEKEHRNDNCTKAAGVIYIALMILCFFLPIPAFMLAKNSINTELLEKRTLASFPEVSLETIDSFSSGFDAWFSDHIPFRRQLIALGGILDFDVMHHSTAGNVVIGKDNWLYTGQRYDYELEDSIADYQGTNLFTTEELAICADNLLKARALCEARGCEFLFAISPSKMSIYPEFLPDRFGSAAEYKRMQQLVDYLRANTDLNVVWLYETLMEYKAKNPEDILFFKYDPHENAKGGYLSSDKILKALGYEGLPPMESLDWKADRGEGRIGTDCLTLLGIELKEMDDAQWVCEDFREHKDIVSSSENNGSETRLSLLNSDGEPKKVMMVSDSFGGSMTWYLVERFNEVFMVYYNKYYPELLDREDPDILIYQLTERKVGNAISFTLEEPYIKPEDRK